MKLSVRQQSRIVARFRKEHWIMDYVSAVGISTVGVCNPKAPEEKKKEPCISVTLQKALPRRKKLPKEYRGMAVYTRLSEGMPKPLQAQ
jgi:hypothetical protein